MTKTTVCLNGEFIPADEAKVSVFDRGFLFGDGVYEVIPVYNGKLFRLLEHMQRLNYSLDQVRIKNPYSENEWQQLFDRLIEQSEDKNLSLYLQVTRGAADVRDHLFDTDLTPTVLLMTRPLAKTNREALNKAISAVTYDDIRWRRCDIKAISLLANVLLRQAAADKNADEAILINNGKAIEGSTSNLFVVKNGKILTPKQDTRILGGITRALIIELAREHGLSMEEVDITTEQLNEADEIWLSSSTKELRAVTRLNQHNVGDGNLGPVYQKMVDLYCDYKSSLYEQE